MISTINPINKAPPAAAMMIIVVVDISLSVVYSAVVLLKRVTLFIVLLTSVAFVSLK